MTKLAKENPYKDVVRYDFKNRKWNLQHVDFYSEALAVGLLENGLQPGDVVLSWLPSHFSESVRANQAEGMNGLNTAPRLILTGHHHVVVLVFAIRFERWSSNLLAASLV